ncbi:hypothetical protein TRFO_08676 [Tritrichomonas foetus]|uniref:Transmembrane 9 superfamily member n=1 Tax=Tritrichomonas foetus TaxID=1144522 RepID=A0A1J4JMD6_9EUKA|nr:hypothetical protein TRFO_08676 [Tritrichomonas foetus]|eukprot:OHS98701.1 hypothetical protein TRFO_08676 [Tritrichomonas foetus]
MLFFSSLLAFSISFGGTTKYKDGDTINIISGSLRSSINTIPVDYKLLNLFCLNSEDPIHSQSFAEQITGEVRYNSPYQFTIGDSSEKCHRICTKEYTKEQRQMLFKLIDEGYSYSFNYLHSSINVRKSDQISHLSVGSNKYGKHYLNNNIQFTITFNTTTSLVENIEITSHNSNRHDDCFSSPPEEVPLEDETPVTFYYSYRFSNIHIDQSFVIDPKIETAFKLQIVPYFVAFISSIFLIVFIQKCVLRENKNYDNDLDEYDGCEWKLIHADVCRPPPKADKLTYIFGWGIQFFVAILLTIIMALISPQRADCVTEVVELFLRNYLISAIFGGFFAGKLFKTLGSFNWKGVTLMSSILLTCGNIAILTLINMFGDSHIFGIGFSKSMIFIVFNFIQSNFLIFTSFVRFVYVKSDIIKGQILPIIENLWS